MLFITLEAVTIKNDQHVSTSDARYGSGLRSGFGSVYVIRFPLLRSTHSSEDLSTTRYKLFYEEPEPNNEMRTIECA